MFTGILNMNRKLAIAIKDYIIITFGLLLFALGWVVFLIPAEITGGGSVVWELCFILLLKFR
jgi:uncharacterized membrane-anchored protein YitT (DUF2179 family)